MPSAETPPTLREILELVARFEQQLDAYKSGQYNETQLRREFLAPFFKLLGWDIDNTAGSAEAYKDVVREDAIRIGDSAKAPDYCFRIGSARIFSLERQIAATDTQIDRLVYDIYGLTEDEIKIVEGTDK